ncbi:BglG family transcription antiterminator [Brevibacillus daliensis]|uniref:BglG family transcription antiterminator n=1 Tax=Brevibacillus daliensis TaxID=2892995 RepID=UPI001E53BB26|nr:BglG family transcription antiterminator [Brevibacillus daliensis]
MALDKRCATILLHVCQADNYVTVQELLESQAVSKRTLYYDIKKISQWLEENQLPPLQYVRSTGYFVDEQTKKLIPPALQLTTNRDNDYSVKERKAWLANQILTKNDRILLEDLIHMLGVSRNTVIEDLKRLKSELESFELTLGFERKHGYLIEGEEQNKRKALIYYLSQAVSTQDWKQLISHIQTLAPLSSSLALSDGETQASVPLFPKEEIQIIRESLAVCERLLGIEYTDEVLESLSIYIHLFRKRFSQGQVVKMDQVEKDVLKKTRHYEAAIYIGNELSKAFSLTFSEDDICYIATHLLGARVDNQKQHNKESSSSRLLRQVVQQMVTDFQKYACIIFVDVIGLQHDLFMHLKPAFYRVKYGIYVDNPLVESIKTHYHEIFVLTEKVMNHFERLIGHPVSDHETAYITMHFGAWLRKQGANPAPRKKALIVCPAGEDTSLILKTQLESLFSTIDISKTVTLQELKSVSHEVDLIFSTSILATSNVPILLVNPILNDTEKAHLLNRLAVLFGTSEKESVPSKTVDDIISIISKHAAISNEDTLHKELNTYLTDRTVLAGSNRYTPTLSDLLPKEHIRLVHSVSSWQEAIRQASIPLVENGSINTGYVDTMIKKVEEYGPYIVIAPQVAIPHARPIDGVNRVGMSLLLIKQAVSFSDDPENSVHLVITLATTDNESHIKALSQLTTLLSDKETLQKLLTTGSVDDILALIHSKDIPC